VSPEETPVRLEIESAGLFAPGAAVFVVLHKDPFRERIDVRLSRVLDREEDVLFLAQTVPPVPAELRGADVEIAVLPPEHMRPRRPVGYAARLLDLREDFPRGPEALAGEDRSPVPALAVTAPGPGDLFETSLRMHHRVPVDPEMNVVLQLAGGYKVELLDFSAGGARARVSPPEPQPAPAAPLWPAPQQAGFVQPAPVPAAAGQPAEVEEPDGELDDTPAPAPPAPPADPLTLAAGQSLPFRLLFLGSGFAEGDAVLRSVRPADDGVSVLLGMSFTNMEIRDIRYMERMVARTVSACRQRERDADYD
jgi:hypothetical protein